MAQVITTQQFPYTYEGMDKKGQKVKGRILAASEQAVKADLRRQGIIAKKIRKQSQLFKSDKKIAKRDSVLAGANWKYVFVHGVVRDTRELEHIKGRDIELITYKQVLVDLRDDEATQSSSAANNIVELLRFMQQPLD